jgi:ferric iron reductase protein FhuF
MSGFPLLPGALAPLVESLVPFPAAGALPARLFLEPEGPARLLDAARRHRPEAEERALTSLWSRWYFAKLIPPVLLCGVVGQRRLPLAPADTAVVLGADGLPRAIALPHAGDVAPDDNPFTHFGTLVQDHVGAVVRSLAAHAHLAPRVLWNNAAVYADWTLRRLGDQPGVSPAAAQRALELVERPDWPGGAPNPFHAPVAHHAGAAGRCAVRRQCCLLYRLPGERMCRTCPRLSQSRTTPLYENENHSHNGAGQPVERVQGTTE